jgi:hypothetical protein
MLWNVDGKLKSENRNWKVETRNGKSEERAD